MTEERLAFEHGVEMDGGDGTALAVSIPFYPYPKTIHDDRHELGTFRDRDVIAIGQN